MCLLKHIEHVLFRFVHNKPYVALFKTPIPDFFLNCEKEFLTFVKKKYYFVSNLCAVLVTRKLLVRLTAFLTLQKLEDASEKSGMTAYMINYYCETCEQRIMYRTFTDLTTYLTKCRTGKQLTNCNFLMYVLRADHKTFLIVLVVDSKHFIPLHLLLWWMATSLRSIIYSNSASDVRFLLVCSKQAITY